MALPTRLTVVLAIAVALVGGCALPGPARPAATPAGPGARPAVTPVPLPGILLYARDGNLWTLTLRTGTEQPITSFPAGSFAVFPALSPDGRSIAFSLVQMATDPKTPAGTDLYVVDLDGKSPRRVLAHGVADASLEMPVWTPDGQTIYYTYREPRYEKNTYVGQTVQVQRVNLDGSGRTVVAEGGLNPALSPDGRRLLWLKVNLEQGTSQLWIAEADGSHARRFVEDDGFQAFVTPRFSPDGKRVLFSAVGGPAPAPTPTKTSKRTGGHWLALGWPAVAEAHGVPWDLWVVNADGTGLRRLTDLGDDNPIGTWSPDGQHVAFLGEFGLYVVQADGGGLVRVAQLVGGAGVAWAPGE